MFPFSLKNYEFCSTSHGDLSVSDLLSSFSSDNFTIFQDHKIFTVDGQFYAVPYFISPSLPRCDLYTFSYRPNLCVMDTRFGLVGLFSELSFHSWLAHTNPLDCLGKYFVATTASRLSPFFDTFDEAFDYFFLNFDTFGEGTLFIFQTTEFNLSSGKVMSYRWFPFYIVIPFPCCSLDYSPIVRLLGGTPA